MVLACSTTFFQLFLFCATFFQLLMFMLFISSQISSSQRVLGLPIGLLDMGFHLLIFCTILCSAMRSTWPKQFNLCFLINPIIFFPFNISFISWLVNVCICVQNYRHFHLIRLQYSWFYSVFRCTFVPKHADLRHMASVVSVWHLMTLFELPKFLSVRWLYLKNVMSVLTWSVGTKNHIPAIKCLGHEGGASQRFIYEISCSWRQLSAPSLVPRATLPGA